jgi:hypothetical protein
MSGHALGAVDAGRRTNQRAAHAAPTAQTEPKMLATRQNNDSQSVASAVVCSRAILHISVQKPVRIDNVAATGFVGRRPVFLFRAPRQIAHRDYDIATLRRQNPRARPSPAGRVAHLRSAPTNSARLPKGLSVSRSREEMPPRVVTRCSAQPALFVRRGLCWHKS